MSEKKTPDTLTQNVKSVGDLIDPYIKLLLKDMKRRGFKTVKDMIKHLMDNWNYEDVIYEHYQAFLRAVQEGNQPKMFGEGYWSEKDSFEDWLAQTEQTIKYRLHYLKKQRKQRERTFKKLMPLIEAKPETVKDIPPGTGEELSAEDYEFYEEILRKTLETIHEFKMGSVKLPTKPSWEEELESKNK